MGGFVRAAGILALAMLTACATPRADRDWLPYLAHTAHVDQSATRFSVTPVIDWSYAPEGPSDQSLTAATFDFDELVGVWFVLEPQPGSRLTAHTLLIFEFADERLLGLTIEARREADEGYSAVRGAFNAYELAYVWASARDLLTRRAVYLRHDVFIYPIAIDAAQKRALISRLLTRTAALETRPRFYNTLTSNCTNELAKATDLKWHSSFVLTGTADDHLFRIGLIPGESFAEAHARSDMRDFVSMLNASVGKAEFDAALLAELRRRNPPMPAPSRAD